MIFVWISFIIAFVTCETKSSRKFAKYKYRENDTQKGWKIELHCNLQNKSLLYLIEAKEPFSGTSFAFPNQTFVGKFGKPYAAPHATMTIKKRKAKHLFNIVKH